MVHTLSYVFRHRRAIFMELIQQRCNSQPANTCSVLSCKLTEKLYFLKVRNSVKTYKTDSNDSLQYSVVL